MVVWDAGSSRTSSRWRGCGVCSACCVGPFSCDGGTIQGDPRATKSDPWLEKTQVMHYKFTPGSASFCLKRPLPEPAPLTVYPLVKKGSTFPQFPSQANPFLSYQKPWSCISRAKTHSWTQGSSATSQSYTNISFAALCRLCTEFSAALQHIIFFVDRVEPSLGFIQKRDTPFHPTRWRSPVIS